MNEIARYFTSVSDKLPIYARYIHIVVIVAIILLTEAVKIPLRKYIIDVKITNVNLRKKINLAFMILPFIFGLSASGILTLFKYPFSWEAGITWGVYSQVVYELIARIFKRIKNNEDITTDVIVDDFTEIKDNAEATGEELGKKVEQASKDFDDFIKKIKGE